MAERRGELTRLFIVLVAAACTAVICTSGLLAWKVVSDRTASLLQKTEFDRYRTWVELQFVEVRMELQKAAEHRGRLEAQRKDDGG